MLSGKAKTRSYNKLIIKEVSNNEGYKMKNEASFIMPSSRILDCVWLVLLVITISTALIAESAEPSLTTTLIISIAIAVKGRLVIDYLMALKNANPTIKKMMRAYFYVIPLMIVWVYLFPDTLARWTSLS